jgi:hypothetical protein
MHPCGNAATKGCIWPERLPGRHGVLLTCSHSACTSPEACTGGEETVRTVKMSGGRMVRMDAGGMSSLAVCQRRIWAL